jgi:4-oxalocrotonate tautomerase
MPFARISVDESVTSPQIKAISEGIYNSLIEAINTPVDDRFQVITKHKKGELVFDANYLGISRTDAFVLIQIFLYPGRTLEQKKLLFETIAEKLGQDPGIRKEDVWINLVEVPKENWSYGNGEAQFA